MRWLRTVIAISDNDVSHSTALSALAIVRPETVIRWHPLAVCEPLQRRKKAQDTREPYLATTGGHDERMSSVSSIAGAVNVVLPRGKVTTKTGRQKPQ